MTETQPIAVRPAASNRVRTTGWRVAATATHALSRTTSAARALPDFLIAGAQRAGTTSLYQYLSTHPAVVPPRLIKGAHYFDLHFAEDLDWYRAHFPTRRRLARVAAGLGCRAVTGEGSPYYMFHPSIPDRIATTLPEVNVIVVLRDPVNRAWSQYQHEFARGYDQLSFEGALVAENERLEGEVPRLLRDPAYVSRSHVHHSYVGRGRYIEQIRRLHKALGADRVLVCEFGELKRDAQAVFNRVTDFLGLPKWQLAAPVAHNARSYQSMRPETKQWLARQFEEANQELFVALGVQWDWTAP